MTETLVGVVVGAILTGAVTYFVSLVLRKRDEHQLKRTRQADLRSALVFILKELKAANENPTIRPTIRRDNKVEYPPPILASGLDLLKTRSLFNEIQNETQNSLLRLLPSNQPLYPAFTKLVCLEGRRGRANGD